MKRDKDEEKLRKPLFPRVHVRDTEKGWPRAPPRNKMAMYEQFTVASHKSKYGDYHSGNETSAKLNFSVQQVPPAIPVRDSREHNVQQSDATSVISSASRRISREQTGLDDDYAVSVLENSNQGVNRRQSDTENGFDCGDGEMGNATEISSCLDDGIVPAKRSEEPFVLDNDNDDDDDDDNSNAGVSDISVVGSASGWDLSLDDVVGAIGQRHFWRAKNAISKQQRLFAKQVFELHRLVKVQRLIAESPHLMFDDGIVKVKSTLGEKLLEPGSVVKPRPRYAGFKDDTREAVHCRDTEGSAENNPGRLPPLSQGQNFNLPSYPLHHPGKPLTTDPGRKSIQPSSEHQWLIPVMSPSEGLIYKPYPAPLGFTPGYGGYGHFCDFTSPHHGFPAPPQQQGQFSLPVAHPMLGYFPPYSMPATNPTTFLGMHMMDQRTPSNRPGSVVQDQRSCNMPGRANVTTPQVTTDSVRLEPWKQSEDISRCPSNLRDSEGSTAAQPGRVIRAVPHNPRLATKSAAQIFRSIQDERRRL